MMNEDDFNSPGIDYDIDNHLLNAGHRYLHIGYVRLKQGKERREWTFARLARYHARIVDAMPEAGRSYPPSSDNGLKDDTGQSVGRIRKIASATTG